MTATYNPNIVTDTDKVRFLIQDTVVAKALFQDSEIAYMLIGTTPEQAAIKAALALAAKYSSLADTTIETVSVRNSQKAAAYIALANTLQKQFDNTSTSGSGPSATGISISEMDDVYQDTDRRIDDVRQDMFKNESFWRKPYTR